MRPLALLHSLYEVLKVILCIALLVQADDGEVESDEGSREGKQFGSGRPGSGMRSRGQLSRLEQGPLTLQGGKLRPVVERLNRPNPGPVDRVGGMRQGLQRRPGVLPLLPQNPRPPLPSLRPQQYFPSDNVSVIVPFDLFTSATGTISLQCPASSARSAYVRPKLTQRAVSQLRGGGKRPRCRSLKANPDDSAKAVPECPAES